MSPREPDVWLGALFAVVITLSSCLWIADPAPVRPDDHVAAEEATTAEAVALPQVERSPAARAGGIGGAPLQARPAKTSAATHEVADAVWTVRAVQALQRAGDDASRQMLARIGTDAHADTTARVAALRALGDLPRPDDEALAALWQGADGSEHTDGAAELTHAALCALGRALRQLPAGDDRAATGQRRLAHALRCAATPARQRLLLRTLAAAGHPQLSTEALPFLQSPNGAVRAAAAQALAAADGAVARRIVREVAALTSDVEVRRILVRGIALDGSGG